MKNTHIQLMKSTQDNHKIFNGKRRTQAVSSAHVSWQPGRMLQGNQINIFNFPHKYMPAFTRNRNCIKGIVTRD
jgi:hypothetical protein